MYLIGKAMKNVILKALMYVGDYVMLIINVIAVTFRSPPQWSLIRDQLFGIGVMSLPVVSITGFSTGLVLAAQSFFQLSDKGLASATGLMVAKAMLVELGPILTAFMITGRVGAAMCAEIGTMHVTEQIDALKSMAVNPLRYIIAPRFIAGAIMVPILTIFSCLMGVIGGYLIAVYHYNISPVVFMDPITANITNFDFISGLIKAFVFGIFIVTISCYKGLKTEGGAAGVGKSTTNSVVICYSVILIVNFVLTVFMNTMYTAIVRS